jgi:hypothetical protein
MTFDASPCTTDGHAGKVRALGVTAKRRPATPPQVPTIAEAGQRMGLAGGDVSNRLCVPRSHSSAKAPPPATG